MIKLPRDPLPAFPEGVLFFRSVPEDHWIITLPDRERRNAGCWEVYSDVIRHFPDQTEEGYCRRGESRFKYVQYSHTLALLELARIPTDQQLPEGF